MQYNNFNASGCIKASSCLNDSSCLNASGCIYASRCLNTSSCLNASGCMNGSGCLNAGGSTDVFHTIALIISGRPRVPIVCAERIIVSEAMSNTSRLAEEILQSESIRFFRHFFCLASSLK